MALQVRMWYHSITMVAVKAIRRKTMGKIIKKGLGILGIVLLVAIVGLLVIEL